MDTIRLLDRWSQPGVRGAPLPRTRPPLDFRQVVWLFPVAFACTCSRKLPASLHGSSATPLSDTPKPIHSQQRLGLAFTVGATCMVWRFANNRPVFFVYYSAVLTQQALSNTLFHAGSTVAFGAYSPGSLPAYSCSYPSGTT